MSPERIPKNKIEEVPWSNGLEVLTGKSNPKLARSVAEKLHSRLDEPVSKFQDGERRVNLEYNLRRKDVFIIQTTGRPKTNARIFELFGMLDAARRESPSEITAVIPYLAYQRQERQDGPGTPIMAAVVAKTIEHLGADNIVTVDIHAEATMGAVNIPWTNLYASEVLVPAVQDYVGDCRDFVVMAPDKGGVPRAIKYGELLGTKEEVANAYKLRDTKEGTTKTMYMSGDVNDKRVLLVDDILASGSTLIGAARIAKDNGATNIYAAVTHGQFLGNAIDDLNDSPIEKIFVTDTLKIKKTIQNHPKIEVVSVDSLLADAIYNIHTGENK